jgi:hypothetical protein
MFGIWFVNPILLWGTAAAGVPLLLHLLRRQRYRDVPFSSLIFLSPNLRRQLRASRFSHLLLLLLRMLVLVALSLAVAGPQIGGLASDGRAASVAIVLDRSASMGARSEGKRAWDRARELALARIASLGPSDRITILGAAARLTSFLVDKPGAREEADQLLRRLEPTALGGDLSGAVREALAILERSDLTSRRLILLSDGQEAIDPSLEAVSKGVELEIIEFVPRSVANLHVTELRLPRLLGVASTRRVVVRVGNGGSHRGIGSIRLNIGGAYLGERAVDLRPGSGTELRFDVSIPPGVQPGFVEVSGDDLAADNLRFFVLGLDRRTPVVVVGRPQLRRFVELALGVQEETSRGGFEVIGVNRLGEAIQAGPMPRAVVLCGLEALASDREALLSARSAGAGVLVFLGAETAPSLANEVLADGSLLPLRLTGRESGSWMVRPRGASHPAVPDDGRLAGLLEQIELRERHRIVPLGQGGETLLEYSDGEPFLSELRGQTPPVLVAATSADRSSGDLVLSPYFVLLVRRSAELLSGPREGGALIAGVALPNTEVGSWQWIDDPARPRPKAMDQEFLATAGALVHLDGAGVPDGWREVIVDPSESRLEPQGSTRTTPAGRPPEPSLPRRSVALHLALLALALLVVEGLLTASLTTREAMG